MASDLDNVYKYNVEMVLEMDEAGAAKWNKLTKDHLNQDEWNSAKVYFKVKDEDGWFPVPASHTDHTHAKYGLSYGAF